MYFTRWRTVLLAAALALLVALASGSKTLADDYSCRGSVGAIRVESLRVPPNATCRLNGTIVDQGNFVENNATLYANEVQVGGNLQANRATRVNVTTGSFVGGSIQIHNSGAAVIQGVEIDSDLFFEDNDRSLRADNNTISGNLQAFKNTGGVSINGNTIGGNLQCKENDPPPTGAGNNVNGNMEDQCENFGGDPPPAATDTPRPPTNTSPAPTNTRQAATNTPAPSNTPPAPTNSPPAPTLPPPAPTNTPRVPTHTPAGPTSTPQIIDQEAPSVRWIAPVQAGGRYDLSAGAQVRLAAEASDNRGIGQVQFFRWDAVKNQYITIANLVQPPYQTDISASALNAEWNQVFVIASDQAGNTSDYPFIWLYKLGEDQKGVLIYLPFTRK
jgi:hypothetical protein